MKHKILIHFFLQTLLFIFLSGQQSLFSQLAQGCCSNEPPVSCNYGTIHVTHEVPYECICVFNGEHTIQYCMKHADKEGECYINVVCGYKYSVWDNSTSDLTPGFYVGCGDTTDPITIPESYPGCCSDNTKTGTMESADFRLAQNYPNPFNPVTKINYYIAMPTEVKLTVYDVLGNEIALLVSEFESPGAYSVDFDGSNLPSGVYIYKIEAGTFSAVKKLLLMK